MIKKLLLLVIMIATSISAFSSDEDQKGISLQLISSIRNNNCAYFTYENYNKDESHIAIMYSNECAAKYYKELLDPNSFEQVFTFLGYLILNNNINLTTKLYKDTLNNFTDAQHFHTLNSICLWADNYKIFLDIYTEEFPWNKTIISQIRFCKVQLERAKPQLSPAPTK